MTTTWVWARRACSGRPLALAGRSSATTLLARSAMRYVAQAGLCDATGVDADWRDGEGYLEAIESAVARSGPVDLGVVWLHAEASAILPGLFSLLGGGGCRVIHVLGSSRPAAGRRLAAQHTGLVYHTVTLGSVQEGGSRRWLTHDEIVAGVLACERDASDIVVGELGSV
ncbi:hypothetical protein OT109_08855 [Phycisphaeraceae bacterium D3-23]